MSARIFARDGVSCAECGAACESGGLRKVRFGGRGKGKSGGYRVITGYFGLHVPVYLVALLSKRDRGNFSKAEIAGFRKLTTDIARYFRRRST